MKFGKLGLRFLDSPCRSYETQVILDNDGPRGSLVLCGGLHALHRMRPNLQSE